MARGPLTPLQLRNGRWCLAINDVRVTVESWATLEGAQFALDVCEWRVNAVYRRMMKDWAEVEERLWREAEEEGVL